MAFKRRLRVPDVWPDVWSVKTMVVRGIYKRSNAAYKTVKPRLFAKYRGPAGDSGLAGPLHGRETRFQRPNAISQ